MQIHDFDAVSINDPCLYFLSLPQWSRFVGIQISKDNWVMKKLDTITKYLRNGQEYINRILELREMGLYRCNNVCLMLLWNYHIVDILSMYSNTMKRMNSLISFRKKAAKIEFDLYVETNLPELLDFYLSNNRHVAYFFVIMNKHKLGLSIAKLSKLTTTSSKLATN